MLHSLRKRLNAKAEAEARGDSLWTSGFDTLVRNRIRHAYSRIATGHGMEPSRAYPRARQMILEQGGLEYLSSRGLDPATDFYAALADSDDVTYPTLIESLLLSAHSWGQRNYAHRLGPDLVVAFNEILAQERVAWKLNGAEMIEMGSTELYASVVEPALRLLHDTRFRAVDTTYRKALDELARGDGADAVTDAGTALQEMLTALGCSGNQLGDLIRSARKQKLFGAHDTPLADVLDRAMQWVAADRSQTGESHHASNAGRDDAWLVIHVVGAIIVRLAGDSARPD